MKWQTPHQKAKAEAATLRGRRGGGKSIEPGDVGIWVTCMKNKEGKATEELKGLFEEYAEKIYGIVPASESSTRGGHHDEDEDEEDIEASIRRELTSLSDQPIRPLQPVHLDVPCVLFFRTAPPIVPVDFVRAICEDAARHPARRRCRFVNRLSPMAGMARATEKGLEEVGRRVLGEHFRLQGEGDRRDVTEAGNCSYAIRPTIRNHSTLKRDAVIKLVANLVDPSHKVDLTKPDKTIVIEIYQTICGMAVLDSIWETHLKRFNLFEIYQSASNTGSISRKASESATQPNCG
ncbi:MAG: hypothetical protein M1818_007841 [Claussenomyces sp. TS43310]|nr:MAG: hypothetical protein M1818_007841 [Claussenomyces sp. TS43310]